MIKQLSKLLSRTLAGFLLSLLCMLSFSFHVYAAPADFTDLMAGAKYDETNDWYCQEEGDGILTEDYTLPENTTLHWYGGNLTIASGVTLTISEGSCLEMSFDPITGKNRTFLLEEGATIRILGDIDYDEYGALKTRLNFIHVNVKINGTIESNVQGLDASQSDITLNGTIHSNGPTICYEQCEITFLGGEYLANESSITERKYEQAFEGIIEVYDGVFSKEMAKATLMDGITMHKREDGTYEAITIPEEESNLSEAENTHEQGSLMDKLKNFFSSAVSKVKEVFNEAVAANGGIKEAWKRPEFLVCMIMVLGILAGFLYYIYDFIRAPLKKKFKILIETALVIIIVGGGFWLIWEYVTKDLEAQQALTRPEYSEEIEVVTTFIEDKRSYMNGLDAYGPGIYQIGKDIDPGTYYLEADDLSANINPFYIYFSKTPDFKEKEVGLWVSRSYVEFERGWYVTVIGAHFVKAGEQAVYEPSEIDGCPSYTPGEYLVGRDLAPGTYSYEPNSNETFHIQVRDGAITAKEVSWTSYDSDGQNTYDMSSQPTQFTVREGQTITVAPWNSAKLTPIE